MKEDKTVTKTERGWAGHYICANSCRFRRNTLLEYNKIKIVVSTVGGYLLNNKFETIGGDGRYYETMAFHSNPEDTRYHDIDVTKRIDFNSDWQIYELDADDKANEMHDAVVFEIISDLSRGKTYQ